MAQKKQQTEDLRVRRTRKLLMQALIELSIEKGFSTLTVQDIVDRAMINRATFYRHYLDKYDLLDKYMTEVYELTASQETMPSSPGSSGNPPVGLVKMFEHVQQHANFYRAMLGSKGDLAFVERIRQYSEMRLRSLLPDTSSALSSNSPPLEFCLSYLSHAGVGVMAWWLKEGQSYSPEQIAVWTSQLNKVTFEHVVVEGGVEKP